MYVQCMYSWKIWFLKTVETCVDQCLKPLNFSTWKHWHSINKMCCMSMHVFAEAQLNACKICQEKSSWTCKSCYLNMISANFSTSGIWNMRFPEVKCPTVFQTGFSKLLSLVDLGTCCGILKNKVMCWHSCHDTAWLACHSVTHIMCVFYK